MYEKRHKMTSAFIIHGFAVLHVLLTLMFRVAEMDDSLILTMMTMLMTVWLCFRRGLDIELTAACAILVNVLGFFSGMALASVFRLVSDSVLLVHSLATFLTTEILGWGIVWVSGLFRKGTSDLSWSADMKWFLAGCVAILLVRVSYTWIFAGPYSSSDEIYRMLGEFVVNVPVMLMFICLNIVYVRYTQKFVKGWRMVWKLMLFSVFAVTVSCAMAALVGMEGLSPERFLMYCFPSVLVEVTVYFIIYIMDYALRVRNDMRKQKEKAEHAEYRYFKLKQQLNPHFLFNSLNILDGLVTGSGSVQASEYVHKLAGIYRYMLRNEEEDVVTLKDEMEFVGLYTDLLKVRFSDGFTVTVDIREEDMQRMVVPCSIQLLVENAIKHNVVGGDRPLVITISSDGEWVTVSNVLIPKMTEVQSTGVGQKYLKEEYLRRAGKTVSACKTDTEYIIKLPLL